VTEQEGQRLIPAGRHGEDDMPTTESPASFCAWVATVKPAAWHGTTSGYWTHKCKCGACRDAYNRWHRAYRAGDLGLLR
jgi:hypothetical protein